MILFSTNSIYFLKKFWLLISLLVIFFILIRKADEDYSNSINFYFLNSSKKSEKFLDTIIWSTIILYLFLGLLVSINKR
uniref:hypothetical protein n=1 Tax=Merotricha bacillata TaxID=658122 RepID=UPI00211432C6|nr:hypothetical protein NQZ01_pgp074 [Merotricha bacillata]UTE94580.1 hypothetical protein MbacPt_p107 [Merotricha bacillata]